jgi:hypothetical protein
MKTEYWTSWRHSRGVETRRFVSQWAAESDLGRAIYDGDEDDFIGAQIVQIDNERLIASAVIDLLPAGREWARLARAEEDYELTQRASWIGSVPARAA